MVLLNVLYINVYYVTDTAKGFCNNRSTKKYFVTMSFLLLQMNYNFNSQFPFPWSSGNPYLSNGFPGSNNAAMQPINPSGTQPSFSLQHAAGQAQGYNCSGIIGPGVRFFDRTVPIWH